MRRKTMTIPPATPTHRLARAAAGLLAALLSTACSSWIPAKPVAPTFYALDGGPTAPVAVGPGRGEATLIVQPTHAVAGYDSARIVYRREPHSPATYTQSEWVDSPARMLTPLIVASLQARPDAFRAVLTAPSAALTDLRLDTDIVRLQHEFDGEAAGSRVRFTLRATLTHTASRRVVASQVFDETAPAPSDDARGGVAAANQAVQAALAKLGGFCAEAAAGQRQAAQGGAPN